MLRLRIQNIRNIELADFKFDPTVAEFSICGPNGAGKSTVLMCIRAALMGKKAMSAEPVRHGEKTGKIILEVGDIDETHFTATLTYSAKRDTAKVEVVRDDGDPFGYKPLEALRLIFNPISLQPMDFATAKPEERVTMVAHYLGGYDMNKHKKQIAALREQRAKFGSAKTKVEGAISQLPDIPPKTPVKEISMSDIAAEHENAIAHNRKNAIVFSKSEEAAKAQNDCATAVERAKDAVTSAQQALDRARLDLTVCQDEFNAAKRSAREWIEATEEVHDIDADTIRSRMGGIEKINENVRARKNKERLEGDLREAAADWREIQNQIKEIEQRKLEVFTNIRMPVEGLIVTDEDLRYNGTLIESMSLAERVEIGCGIALETPEIWRTLLIGDGNSLDPDTRERIVTMCRERGFMVLFEEVIPMPEAHGYRLEGGVPCDLREGEGDENAAGLVDPAEE